METFVEYSRLSAFVVIGMILPQALGYFAYRSIRSKGKAVAALSVLVPPIFFYMAAYLFWTISANEIRQQGLRVCGAFGAAAGISTVFGTILHLIVAGLAFVTVCWVLIRRSVQPSKQLS
jgi:hypothetical protein